MNPELLKESGNLINQFGFPIFFGIVSLLFLLLIIRYFIRTIDKKDSVFLVYIDKRDMQISAIVENHNNALKGVSDSIKENTSATNKLRESVITRTRNAKKETQILQDISEKVHTSDSPNN